MQYCRLTDSNSVFLFAKEVGWETLATKPYTDTDVLLASNWRTQKQRERWLIALSISLAQTLKCNRFWQNTSVISAEVSTWWTELQGKGSPPTYTLDKFWARKGIFCTFFPCQICMGLHKIYSYALLTKREVKMAGYWPSSFFRFYGLRRRRKNYFSAKTKFAWWSRVNTILSSNP